ncbi:serine--tRNA ligase, partial [Candidatus Peregrinibacteria bacterium]|nr:serine--tRNA ligase [Candidatus Peregrinibacteria bacterium]
MIDLDDLRKRPAVYEKAVKEKCIDVNVKGFLKLDMRRRELIQRVEEDRAKKNNVSKRIPGMKGREKETALTEMKSLSDHLKEQEAELQKMETTWREMQLLLPSLPLDRVPRGKDEKGNREVRRWGDVSSLDYARDDTKHDHVTIGEALDIIDIPRGVKVAGARSYFLKGDGARLELALLQFTIDHLLKKGLPAGRQGWTLFTPPLMATGECLMGTGFFPGAEEQTYAVDDDRYLIGTSEVSVCSYH